MKYALTWHKLCRKRRYKMIATDVNTFKNWHEDVKPTVYVNWRNNYQNRRWQMMVFLIVRAVITILSFGHRTDVGKKTYFEYID